MLDRNEYDESTLKEIRVSIDLPYTADMSTFERVDGEIEIGGQHYKYVKRKIEKGELVLMCLPNPEKGIIQSARNNFFKVVNDLQQNTTSGKKSDSGNSFSIKSFTTDCRQETNDWDMSFVSSVHSSPGTFNSTLLSFDYTFTPEQPPDC